MNLDENSNIAQDRPSSPPSNTILAPSLPQTDLFPAPRTASPVSSESSISHSTEVQQNMESNTNDAESRKMNYINSDEEVESIENDDSDDAELTNINAFEPLALTPSTAIHSSPNTSREHDEYEEDSETTDDEVESVSTDDDEDVDPSISSLLWPHEEEHEATVRSPISAEPWSIEYTSRIKSLVEHALIKSGISYFFALAVLSMGSIEIAVMVVLTGTSEDAIAASKTLENVIRDSDYVWIFGKETITRSASHSSITQYPRYHKNIQCGNAIEACKNETGTAGLFIHKPNSGRIHGITAGHVFENLSPGHPVIQPALKHLALDIEEIKYQISLLQFEIKIATKVSVRSKYEDDSRNFQQELNVLHALKGADDRETRQNLKVGKVLSHECCPVIYQGRDCFSDWGIFEVSPERQPETTIFDSYPANHVLASKYWDSVKGLGSLKLDQWVRKTGHVTGLTFGCVAGVHAGWNPGIPNCPPLTEFYIIEENNKSFNMFGSNGDSGAAVITPEGTVVGFMFATIDVTEIEVIVDIKTKVPAMANRRRSDGSVDKYWFWWDLFGSKSFILVECAQMVKMRAGIEGEVFLCN